MMHEFKIVLRAVGGTVEMDGKPLAVKSISVKAATDEVTVVTVDVYASKVEVDGQAYLDVTQMHELVRRLEYLPVK